MKLSIDCMRDIMLFLEKELTAEMNMSNNFVSYETISMVFEKYSTPDIVNHLNVLNDSRFIKAFPEYGDGILCEYLITEILPKGHEFIEKTRSDTAFNKIKSRILEHGFEIIGLFI